mmetsp:Transcript_14379/g.33062  ORF Transcript_14379/g.33062 Transcript_14379/m.33062 type:complete len:90 (+) Transcript_14379:1015-1284(+)
MDIQFQSAKSTRFEIIRDAHVAVYGKTAIVKARSHDRYVKKKALGRTGTDCSLVSDSIGGVIWYSQGSNGVQCAKNHQVDPHSEYEPMK